MPAGASPPPLRRPRHVHKRREWVFHVLLAGILSLAIILGGAIWILTSDRGVPPSPTRSTPSTQAPTSRAAVKADDTPDPTEPDDLVAAARKVQPLEDLQPGDRVLYQGHLCYWRAWGGNINVSTIECTEGERFQIQTARLTPVERKRGPSKLKVRHS